MPKQLNNIYDDCAGIYISDNPRGIYTTTVQKYIPQSSRNISDNSPGMNTTNVQEYIRPIAREYVQLFRNIFDDSSEKHPTVHGEYTW